MPYSENFCELLVLRKCVEDDSTTTTPNFNSKQKLSYSNFSKQKVI